MNQLTKAEEQVMRIVWELQGGTVQTIREEFKHPQPARTTVATVLSVLENKGFVTRQNVERVNVYHPAVDKTTYSKTQLMGVMKNYFNNSFASLALFLAKEENLTIDELDALLEEVREALRAS